MNRRHFLAALAVVLLVVVFVATKIAASWRPVKLGVIQPPNAIGIADIAASDRYVAVANLFSADGLGYGQTTLFDVETSRTRSLEVGSISDEGAWTWRLQLKDNPRLLLSQGEQTPIVYEFPARAHPLSHSEVILVRVRPRLNRVDVVSRDHLFRWNFRSRQLEGLVEPKGLFFGQRKNAALSRDGSSFTIAFNSQQAIFRFDARTGRLMKRVAVAALTDFNSARLTRFGTFVLYRESGTNWRDQPWHVARASDGHALWGFSEVYLSDDFALSPDEKEIALPNRPRKRWEIRELTTGDILRTLPMVTGAQRGVYSPDNTTLYSVANGVLYRQRAR